jgi:hypothetical protein
VSYQSIPLDPRATKELAFTSLATYIDPPTPIPPPTTNDPLDTLVDAAVPVTNKSPIVLLSKDVILVAFTNPTVLDTASKNCVFTALPTYTDPAIPIPPPTTNDPLEMLVDSSVALIIVPLVPVIVTAFTVTFPSVAPVACNDVIPALVVVSERVVIAFDVTFPSVALVACSDAASAVPSVALDTVAFVTVKFDAVDDANSAFVDTREFSTALDTVALLEIVFTESTFALEILPATSVFALTFTARILPALTLSATSVPDAVTFVKNPDGAVNKLALAVPDTVNVPAFTVPAEKLLDTRFPTVPLLAEIVDEFTFVARSDPNVPAVPVIVPPTNVLDTSVPIVADVPTIVCIVALDIVPEVKFTTSANNPLEFISARVVDGKDPTVENPFTVTFVA